MTTAVVVETLESPDHSRKTKPYVKGRKFSRSSAKSLCRQMSAPVAACVQPHSIHAAPLIVIAGRVVTPTAIRLVLNANLAVLGLVPGVLRK
jgi:hypothetical protein